jgi:hypothetical protein
MQTQVKAIFEELKFLLAENDFQLEPLKDKVVGIMGLLNEYGVENEEQVSK